MRLLNNSIIVMLQHDVLVQFKGHLMRKFCEVTKKKVLKVIY